MVRDYDGSNVNDESGDDAEKLEILSSAPQKLENLPVRGNQLITLLDCDFMGQANLDHLQVSCLL